MDELCFDAPGAGGCRVQLRLLGTDQQLDCFLAELAAEPFVPREEPEAPPEPPGRTDSGVGTPDEDPEWLAGVMEISTPMVVLADDETNPAWWIQPAAGPGALVTLAYALGLLTPAQRGAAVAAHLAVMVELVAHHRSTLDLLELSAGGDGDWDVTVEPHCAACWAEPELHAEFLAEALLERARELADAVTLFPMEITAAGGAGPF